MAKLAHRRRHCLRCGDLAGRGHLRIPPYHLDVSTTHAFDAPPRRSRPRRRPLTLLGVVGELLVTLGALLGLFVVWQLWWTDVVAAQEQEAALRELDWVVDTRPETRHADDHALPAPRSRDLGAPPVLAEPAVGATFATLRVPRWGTDYLRAVSQGSSREVLDELGIGHYEGTAMPGGLGNFAISGHRTTYNKPFNRIEELQVGDPLIVQTADTWFVYRVSGMEIVSPDQVEVIAPVPNSPGSVPSVAMMTLTTCHPMYSARQRYVVYSVLEYWMPVSQGVPPEVDLVPPLE